MSDYNPVCGFAGCTINHDETEEEYWLAVWNRAKPVWVTRERKVCRNSLMERVEKDDGKDR